MRLCSVYLITIVCLFSTGCKCDKTYTCPQTRSENHSLTEISPSDTILFTNSQNDSVVFLTSARNQSAAYKASCGRGEPAGCYCPDCEASSSFYALTDTSMGNHHFYTLKVDEIISEGEIYISSMLSIGFLDFHTSLDLLNPQNLPANTVTHSSLTIGAVQYSNVYEISLDTMQQINSTINVWRIYYTKSLGVISFYERSHHSQFIINN